MNSFITNYLVLPINYYLLIRYYSLTIEPYCQICIAQVNTSTITGLSFEWTDGNFTSLLVSWDPVTAPPGGGVIYRIRYSPVLVNDTDMVTKEREESRILLTGLDPDLFYYVMVEAIFHDPLQSNANLGKENVQTPLNIGVCVCFTVKHTPIGCSFVYHSLAVVVGASVGAIGGLIGLVVAIVAFCLLLMW